MQGDVDDVRLERLAHLLADELEQGRRDRAGDEIAWPTSLTVSSSATRWRVSSISRAFSSATLRLAASVVRRRDVALAEGVLAIEVLERDHAARLVADDRTARTGRLGLLALDHLGCPIATARSRACVVDERAARGVSITCLRNPVSGMRLVREAHSPLDRVREVDQAVASGR